MVRPFRAFKERLTRFGARRGRGEAGDAMGGGWGGTRQRGEQPGQRQPQAPDTGPLPLLASEPVFEVGCEQRIPGRVEKRGGGGAETSTQRISRCSGSSPSTPNQT